MSDIQTRTETVPMNQKNKTPKDMAGQKFTENAGTKNETFSVRSHEFNGGHFSVKPQG